MRIFKEEGLEENNLLVDLMSLPAYHQAHQHLVIFCHDVFIQTEKGILLVKRLKEPATNIWWPIGGRVLRGHSLEASLQKKSQAECGLDLQEIKLLEFARTWFKGDPFGHGDGTDTINAVCFAQGTGTLKLDHLHESPAFITPENFSSFGSLHSYVDYYLKWIFEKYW